MTFNKTAHCEISRNLNDPFSYRGIFNNAKEITKLENGIFTVSLQFAKTELTEENMSIEIVIYFNDIIKPSESSQDVDAIKEYAYINNDIKLNMTEEQYNRLTDGDSKYLLPIYKSIIEEAIEAFSVV